MKRLAKITALTLVTLSLLASTALAQGAGTSKGCYKNRHGQTVCIG